MKAKKKHGMYLVLKWDDINELSDCQRNHLRLIIMGIKRKRPHDNKYIVCNQDEPYAEKVWQEILKGEDNKST